jgi:signal peptidase I
MTGTANEPPVPDRAGIWPWWLLGGIVVAVAALVGLILLVTSPRTRLVARGEAMAPAMRDGDRMIVDTSAYRSHDPERGDILVFADPGQSVPETSACGEGRRRFAKRVIGLPGESIDIKRGVVFIDGERLPEPYLGPEEDLGDYGPTQIPKGRIFVMGDNRANSQDSRFLGPIPMPLVCGKVVEIRHR